MFMPQYGQVYCSSLSALAMTLARVLRHAAVEVACCLTMFKPPRSS